MAIVSIYRVARLIYGLKIQVGLKLEGAQKPEASVHRLLVAVGAYTDVW